MICVGIDVSKRKSTVFFMAPGDKIIRRPFDVKHTKEELQPLVDEIRVQAKYDEIKVVMAHKFTLPNDCGPNSAVC